MKWFNRGMLVLALSALFVSGCSAGKAADKPATTLKELGKDESASIKVLYYDKDAFFREYGNLFMFKFPNINVEVVSQQSIFGPGKDMKAEYKKLIDNEKPDVLIFPSPDMFEQWAADGKLYALDDVIKQDKFDVEQILPSVIDTIKAKGNGKLYGLSPTFSSQALYYNKDLFEKYGVPLPKNQMSWEELFQLAKRFPADGQGDQRVYGFASPYSFNGGKDLGFYYMNTIGGTEGLTFVDPDSMKVTLQSEAWKHVLNLTADALKSGAVYVPPNGQPMGAGQPMTMQDYFKKNLFITGKVAMMLDYSYLLDNIERSKEVLTDVTPVNWDIVTVPVNPQDPDVSNSVTVSNLFAINAESQNLRAAWELVKFINGDELAKLNSKTSQGGLLSRTAYLKDKDGRSLEPFYKLKPSQNSLYKGYDKIPMEFFDPFSQLAGQEVQAVVDGKKTVDEALKTMQDKGQESLIKAVQDHEEKQKQTDSTANAGK